MPTINLPESPSLMVDGRGIGVSSLVTRLSCMSIEDFANARLKDYMELFATSHRGWLTLLGARNLKVKDVLLRGTINDTKCILWLLPLFRSMTITMDPNGFDHVSSEIREQNGVTIYEYIDNIIIGLRRQYHPEEYQLAQNQWQNGMNMQIFDDNTFEMDVTITSPISTYRMQSLTPIPLSEDPSIHMPAFVRNPEDVERFGATLVRWWELPEASAGIRVTPRFHTEFLNPEYQTRVAQMERYMKALTSFQMRAVEDAVRDFIVRRGTQTEGDRRKEAAIKAFFPATGTSFLTKKKSGGYDMSKVNLIYQAIENSAIYSRETHGGTLMNRTALLIALAHRKFISECLTAYIPRSNRSNQQTAAQLVLKKLDAVTVDDVISANSGRSIPLPNGYRFEVGPDLKTSVVCALGAYPS